MRRISVVACLVGLALASGCSAEPDDFAGASAPSGTSSRSTAASPAPPSPTRPVARPPTRPAQGAGKIRRTDWRNVTIVGVFGRGELAFRKGTTGGCYILPGGAKPVYGHFINEEPVSVPSTEDALVLIECTDAGVAAQLLIPVQVDGARRVAAGTLEAGPAGATQPRFVSYGLDGADIVATVKSGGRTQKRRWRWGGNGWDPA